MLGIFQYNYDLVILAGEIYEYIKSSNDKFDVLLKNVQFKYKDFADSYPIILRWMVQSKEFDAIAFTKFVKRISVRDHLMWKSASDFIEAQASYLVDLHTINQRRQGKHPGPVDIASYRTWIVSVLEKEHREFREACTEADKRVKEINKIAADERRKRVIATLTHLTQNEIQQLLQ